MSMAKVVKVVKVMYVDSEDEHGEVSVGVIVLLAAGLNLILLVLRLRDASDD